jgi:Icc-related predicted phosphoesterase
MEKNIKSAMIADLHGQLNIAIPKVDLLLIAGDLCPAYHSDILSINWQSCWLNTDFRRWIDAQPIKECVAIFGNHDWIGERAKDRIPKLSKKFHYIDDETIEIFGLKIYGTPVTNMFNNWAFNRSEEVLQKHWDNIPNDTDILLCHSPVFNILDRIGNDASIEHIGSKSLKRRIREIKPKIVVFGHAHGDYGVVNKFGITFINCSLVDEDYKMTKKPIYMEI